VLLLDYEMGRDDERNHFAVQASLFAIALTVLGLFSALLTQSCHFSQQPCLELPDPMLALAPFAPLAIIVYVQLVGSVGTLRSFYLRSLEREIRETLRPNGNIQVYDGLRLPSYIELVTAHGTVARGTRGPRQLIAFIFLGVLVVFGGLTILVVTWMPLYLKIFMLGAYGVGTLSILMEARRATLFGRRFFKETVDKMQSRLGDTLYPKGPDDGPRRKLGSYLLLPRPDDLVKALFFPAAYILALYIGTPANVDLIRALLIWFILELLIYQARYQWNDLRGLDQDLAHPTSALRGRLPVGPDAADVRGAVAASLGTMVLRIWIAFVIGLSPIVDMGWWLIALIGAVFVTGSIYELLRGLRPMSQMALTRVAWAIYLVAGLGYAVRGVSGSTASSLPWSGNVDVYVLMTLFLSFLGSTFVLYTWALESASYCLNPSYDSQGKLEFECFSTLKDRPHLKHLLRFFSFGATFLDEDRTKVERERLRDEARVMKGRRDELMRLLYVPAEGAPSISPAQRKAMRDEITLLRREEGMTQGALTKVLDSRGRLVTPWNAFTVGTGCFAGAFGATISNPDYPLLKYTLLCCLASIILCLASGAVWRIAILVVTIVILLFNGGVSTPILVVPWLVLALVVIFFRAADYRGLKMNWAELPLRRWLTLLATLLLGHGLVRRLVKNGS
jgi:hypothetical protein